MAASPRRLARAAAFALAFCCLSRAATAQSPADCPTAETARLGFTVVLDGGTRFVVGPSAGDIVGYEERRPAPNASELVTTFTSFAGIVTMAQENEQIRILFTFDAPVDTLVPKAVGESVEFTFGADIGTKGQPDRTRRGSQRHDVLAAEEVAVGECRYTAHVFLKSTRFLEEDESIHQRILYVPELKFPLAWRIEQNVKGNVRKTELRAVRIEGRR